MRYWLKELGQFLGIGKSAPVGFVDALALSSVRFPQSSFVNHACEGYGKNEVVFACVNKRAGGFAEAPIAVQGKDGVHHPGDHTRLLLNNPNPFMSEFELWESAMMFYLLGGNAPLMKVRAASRRVVQLWPIRPDHFVIYPHPTKFVDHYGLKVGCNEYPLAVEDVIHFKTYDPLNPYLGMPLLGAALRQYATDNEATEFTKAFLQNRGMPGVVVTTDDEDMNEEKAERLRAKWWQKFGGGRKGGVAFLRKGMDVKTIGLNMRELVFPDLRLIAETRICAAMDVPPIIVGVKAGLDRATFTNYGQAVQYFEETTVQRDRKRFVSRLNADPDLGRDRDGILVYDTSNVTALRGVRDQELKNTIQGYLTGIFTLNEARKRVGMPAVPDGDKFIERTQSDVPGGDVVPRSADPDVLMKELDNVKVAA